MKILIVGASSGIGCALAQQYLHLGHTVGMVARRQSGMARLHKNYSGHSHYKTLDILSDNAIEELEVLITEMGGMDLYIHCAGGGKRNPNADFQIIKETIDLNVSAFSLLTYWAHVHFQNQGSGHIVNISSVAGLSGSQQAPAYFATKAYQISYFKSLTQKGFKAKNKIYFTDVRPGFVGTEKMYNQNEASELFWVCPTDKAAKIIRKGIQKKRAVVYVSRRWRFIGCILMILPSFIHKRLS